MDDMDFLEASGCQDAIAWPWMQWDDMDATGWHEIPWDSMDA